MDRFKTESACVGWRILPAFFMLCTVAGCWQEVEYTGPDPAVASRASEPATSTEEELPAAAPATPSTIVAETAEPATDESSGFANDFADSLAQPSAEPSAEQAAGNALPWEGGAGTAPPGDSSVSDPPTAPVLGNEPAAAVDKYASTAPLEGTPPAIGDAMAGESANSSADIATLPDTSSESASTNMSAETATTAVPTDAATSSADGVTEEPQASTDTTASETATGPGSNGSNPRLEAWRLGSKLSLAALANDRGIAPESVQRGLVDSKSLATSLGTTVADLPERGLAGSSPASRQVLNYLFQQGQQIGRDLADRHGANEAALFEVALKSNLLLVLYTPGSSSADAIASAISQAAPRAELPASLWQPLGNMVTAQADGAEVRKAVRTFHADVERHLADQAEQ